MGVIRFSHSLIAHESVESVLVAQAGVILLSQHHKVYAVGIVPEKVRKIDSRKSPI
jgi:hypothetical protein